MLLAVAGDDTAAIDGDGRVADPARAPLFEQPGDQGDAEILGDGDEPTGEGAVKRFRVRHDGRVHRVHEVAGVLGEDRHASAPLLRDAGEAGDLFQVRALVRPWDELRDGDGCHGSSISDDHSPARTRHRLSTSGTGQRGDPTRPVFPDPSTGRQR